MDIGARRTIALRIYVNAAERKLIDEAVRKELPRNPDRSAWGGQLLLRKACEVLGRQYIYGDRSK